MEITSSMKVNAKKINGVCHSILWILFLLLPFSIFSQSNATILEAPFSYQCQDKLISEILIDLSKLTEVSIAFDAGYFLKKRRSIEAENLALRKILQNVLIGTNSSFELEKSGIVLQHKAVPKEYILSGFVEDESSGERLVAATIYESVSGRGAVTNEYGFFSLTLPAGERAVNCSYLGYQLGSRIIANKNSEQIVFSLKPALTLAAIEVTAALTGQQSSRAFTQPGVQFGEKEIEELPGLGGEADVFRFLQSQPGITTGTDGIGGLHVRGGSTDQNLILLDGVPIFNPSHALGLFSIFNPATLKSATLHRSGYSAKYGGHLSSVLDIRTKEGNVKQFQSSLELSTVATKVSAEIPLGNERGGLMIAARRTHLDPIIGVISRKDKLANDSEGEVNYFFYDVNAKLNYKLGNKDRLYLSFYKGEDKLKDSNYWKFEDNYYGMNAVYEQNMTQFLDWGNTISSLRWNHVYGDKLFSNATLTLSEFKYQNFLAYEYRDDYYGPDFQENFYKRFYTNIQDYRLNISFDYYLNNRHHLLWGATGLRRQFEPGSLTEDLEVLNDTTLTFDEVSDYFEDFFPAEFFVTHEMSFYVEDRIQLNRKHQLSIGLHHALFSNAGATYQSLQPRFRYSWEAKKNLAVHVSASKMTQFLHLLTAADAGLPNDLWVPATEQVGPQHAWEFSLGLQQQLKKGWSWEISTYYKQMQNVLAYEQGASLPGLGDYDPTFWEEEVVIGEGEAFGVETALNWQSPRTLLNVNYTWSNSWRTFDDLNEGEPFPFRYDRPHSLNINIQQRLSKHWKVLAQWNYSTGIPITLFATEFPFFSLDGIISDFATPRSSINGYRLPDYHRLDLSAVVAFGKAAHQHQLTFGAYNVYNRQNPIYTFLVEDDYFSEENGQYDQPGLTIIPTVGYRWNWR